MNTSDVLASIITQSTILDIDHKKYIELSEDQKHETPISKILSKTMELCKEGKIDPWDVDLASFSRIIYDLVSDGTLNLPDAGVLISAAWRVLSMKGDSILGKFSERESEDEYNSENFEPFEDETFLNGETEHYMSRSSITLMPAPVFHKERRKVMLVELMEAISTIDLTSHQKERKVLSPILSMDEISKRLNSEEPEEEIQKVWNRIVELKEDQCFMEDIWGHTVEEKSMFFVYCMFLYRNGKITLNQEEPFGSIRIKRMENA